MSDPKIEQKISNGDIILAFDHWSPTHNWFIPNTCPPDLMVDGKPVLPVTHEILWYQRDNYGHIEPSSNVEDYLNSEPTRTELLLNYLNIQFELLNTLMNFKDVPNWKYIYPVFVHSWRYFHQNEHIGFKFVDKQVFDHVREGKAKIVVLLPFEGFINLEGNRDIEILNNWCSDAGLNADQVYYIHGDWNTSTLPSDLNFTYIPVNAFHCWIGKPRATIEKFNPTDDKNLFLCYSRRGHKHRLIFTCELIRYGLLDRGMVSYHGGDKLDSVERVIELGRPDLVPYAKMLDDIRPVEIDMDLNENNPVGVEPSHYKQTFMSIVLETHSNTSTIFFSEKIWKPISLGQPFVIIAGMNYLTELKKLGYRTFDKWFDESYDQMPDLNDRIKCVITQLRKLSLLSTDELIAMRKDMQEVLFHNQKRFVIQWAEEYKGNPNQFVYTEIEKIWKTF